jgi:DNA-binding XRE family transcriptional regulator
MTSSSTLTNTNFPANYGLTDVDEIGIKMHYIIMSLIDIFDEKGFQETTGEVIKLERKRLKYSQLKVSNISGLDHAYISKLEKGQRMPTIKTIALIAEALGIPLTIFVERITDRIKPFTQP